MLCHTWLLTLHSQGSDAGWGDLLSDLDPNGLALPSLQGKKIIGKKKTIREATAKDVAGYRDKDCPHSDVPGGDPGLDREHGGVPALNIHLPAETEGPENGPGESNLITSLLGLCKSKVWLQRWQG